MCVCATAGCAPGAGRSPAVTREKGEAASGWWVRRLRCRPFPSPSPWSACRPFKVLSRSRHGCPLRKDGRSECHVREESERAERIRTQTGGVRLPKSYQDSHSSSRRAWTMLLHSRSTRSHHQETHNPMLVSMIFYFMFPLGPHHPMPPTRHPRHRLLTMLPRKKIQ